MCIIFRLIMSCVWSVRLLIRRLSVFVSVLPSVCSLFILRWITRLCSLCFLFLFIFSPLFATNVYADDTPTPLPTQTTTNEPLYRTQTPEPTGMYVCPPGQNPHSWGYVTPNAFWLDKCEMCVTRTSVFPTGTMNPSITWTPTQTITPTPTNTITPTSTGYPFTVWKYLYNEGSLSPVYTNVLASDFVWYTSAKDYTSYSGGLNTKFRPYYRSSLQNSSYHMGVWVENNSSCGAYCYQWVVSLNINNSSNGYITLNYAADSYVKPGQIVTIPAGGNEKVYWVNNSGWGGSDLSNTPPIKFDAVILNAKGNNVTDMTTTVEMIDIGNTGARHWEAKFKMVTGGLLPDPNEQTPTPTPSPTLNSYCYDVEGVGQGHDPSLMFKLPSFSVGWARCTQFSGINIGLTFIDALFPNFRSENNIPSSISMTPFQLCFRPLSLGVLTFFGLSFDMDMIAFIMGAVLIIRFVMRGGG